jgi:hypothetical protein
MGGGNSPDDGIEFDGENTIQWAKEHRLDAPIRRCDSASYIETKRELLKVAGNLLAIRRKGSSEQYLEAELRQEYSRLLWNIAPIRWIPDELLTLIFIEYNSLANPSFSDPQALINILITCSHWQQVAQSTPQLWCSFSLPDGLAIARPSWSGHALDTWVRRSKECLLEVEIGDLPHSIIAAPWPSNPLHHLLEACQRIRSLNVDGDDAEHALTGYLQHLDRHISVTEKPFENLAKHRLPCASLEILIANRITVTRRADNFLMRLDAPRLIELHLTECSRVDFTGYAKLVQGTPNVKRLHLDVFWMHESEHQEMDIAHSRLELLNFVVRPREGMDQNNPWNRALASLLKGANGLETLELEFSANTFLHAEPLIASLGRFRPQIHNLSLISYIPPNRIIIRYLFQLIFLFPMVSDLAVQFAYNVQTSFEQDMQIAGVFTLSLFQTAAQRAAQLQRISCTRAPIDSEIFIQQAVPFISEVEKARSDYHVAEVQRTGKIIVEIDRAKILHLGQPITPLAFQEMLGQKLQSPHVEFQVN